MNKDSYSLFSVTKYALLIEKLLLISFDIKKALDVHFLTYPLPFCNPMLINVKLIDSSLLQPSPLQVE